MTPIEVLTIVTSLSVLVYSIGSMFAAGLHEQLSDLLAPLRNLRAVLLALLANFVVAPALAFAIARGLALDGSVAVGILLVGAAAGAPFLLKLTAVARADVGLSSTLLIVLLPATIFFLPLAVPFLAPEAHVSAWTIARPLLLTMLVPLGLGILVRARAPALAKRSIRHLAKITTVALIVLVASLLVGNLGAIGALVGTGAFVASILLVLGAFAAGAVLSPRLGGSRAPLALGTGQRNIAAATVVASQALHDTVATVVVIMTSLIGLAILFPMALWFRTKEGSDRRWQRRAHRTS